MNFIRFLCKFVLHKKFRTCFFPTFFLSDINFKLKQSESLHSKIISHCLKGAAKNLRQSPFCQFRMGKQLLIGQFFAKNLIFFMKAIIWVIY